MTKELISLENVTKVYNAALESKPVTAVDGLSFSVESGGITGFVGPNGAGKTTSIKMILGLIRSSKGVVKLMGESASQNSARENIAYISEQPYFYAHLSAQETLNFVCQMKGIPKKDRKEEITAVLERVELSHRAKAKVKTFSKGMQQRLNMAQALLGSPELIIMDEPMSGLDPLGRRLFRKIFRELADSGVSIFFSTHIIEDIESLCDRVVVLSKGKLKYAGEVQQLIDDSTEGVEYRFSAEQSAKLPSLNENLDLTVVSSPDGSLTISSKSVENSLVEILIAEKVVPLSIAPIRRSLEEILYDKKENA
jgi:ABC-2 type transport system ATP-binding protein